MGTDTEGSIRVPSSHNNIVGLRPTAGLSSREGIIPFGHTQDTGGPMARTVADLALVLDATVGSDPVDEVTLTSQGKIPGTYRSALRADALKGARIDRAFAEPTLLGLAYAFEQVTHHRRPPETTPATLPPADPAPEPSADTGPGSITGTLTATGAKAIPPTDVPFEARIAWSFNEATREFGYDMAVSGNAQDVAGAYLHRRLVEGPRGGVAHVLSKTGGERIVGRKTLTSAEADALKAGNLYMSLLSVETPLRGARADVDWPAAVGG